MFMLVLPIIRKARFLNEAILLTEIAVWVSKQLSYSRICNDSLKAVGQRWSGTAYAQCYPRSVLCLSPFNFGGKSRHILGLGFVTSSVTPSPLLAIYRLRVLIEFPVPLKSSFTHQWPNVQYSARSRGFRGVLVLLSLAHLVTAELAFHSILDARSPQDSNTPVGGVAGNGSASANVICNDPTTFTPEAYAASGADTLLLDIINQMGTRKSP
jgi:hypothetical protein